MSSRFSIWHFIIVTFILVAWTSCQRSPIVYNIERTNWKLDSQYIFNASVAKRDIAKGDVHRVCVGLPPLYFNQWDSLTLKYGFRDHYQSHPYIDEIEKRVDEYNATVEDYLEKLNGKNWKILFDNEVNLLRNINDSVENIH